MIALRLVRLIENHSDELAKDLIEKLQTSARTSDMQKVLEAELRSRIHEILQHLGEWLLTKTGSDIETRYRDLGARRAAQGVSLADFCWAIVLTKEHLWEFLQRQGFLRSPVEIYGELELLRLLTSSLIVPSVMRLKDTNSIPSSHRVQKFMPVSTLV